MNLKKYIYLDYNSNSETIFMKIVNGFTGDNMEKTLNIDKPWQPLGNGQDKCFFMPGCIVPRFKVRDQFTVTIKPANATVLFINKETLTGSDNTVKHYKHCLPVKADVITSYVEALKNFSHLELFRNLRDSGAEILLGRSLWEEVFYRNFLTFNNTSLKDIFDRAKIDFNKYSYKYKSTLPENQLYSVIRNTGLDLVTADFHLDTDILRYVNVNNLIIDEAKYAEFRKMANADSENLILMMELMANADYKKSVVFIMFLLKEFGKDMMALKEVSHINFKSMLSFLALNRSSLENLSLVRMTNILKAHKSFTKKNVYCLYGLYGSQHINYSDPDNAMWEEGLTLKQGEFNNLDKEILV